jgi:hypothetical protein
MTKEIDLQQSDNANNKPARKHITKILILSLLLLVIITNIQLYTTKNELESVKNELSRKMESASSETKAVEKEPYIREVNLEVNSDDWNTHIDKDLNMALKYPDNWQIKKGTHYVKEAIVLYTGARKPSDRSNDEEIIIGDYEVYSTSGSVCANLSCRVIDTFKAPLFGGLARFEIVRAGLPNESAHPFSPHAPYDEDTDFLYYAAYAEGIDVDKFPPVYFSTYTKSRLVEVIKILSTLELVE